MSPVGPSSPLFFEAVVSITPRGIGHVTLQKEKTLVSFNKSRVKLHNNASSEETSCGSLWSWSWDWISFCFAVSITNTAGYLLSLILTKLS